MEQWLDLLKGEGFEGLEVLLKGQVLLKGEGCAGGSGWTCSRVRASLREQWLDPPRILCPEH